jgi:flagellar biosynthesis/type III secretory pathway M-ring protein FliF/YscJ
MILAGVAALPPGKASPYVAAAYIVFVVLVLVYVAILAIRAARIERDVTAMRHQVDQRQAEDDREKVAV